ncbi:MAG: HAE1 family hydrophobic/amphiphilic exporter-1 [Phycisphaerales bacterium]|jgi:HAE1 family hydrophobic/amphiphilic exporter-1
MSLARFGVRHPVVTNLVMFTIIGAGLIFGSRLTREFFPATNPTQVIVAAPYPGASPDEVETALAIKIEDAVKDLDKVKEITTTVREGSATVMVEFHDGVNIDNKVADVKREIDALQDLPNAADRITVTKLEMNLPAIAMSLYGDADERTMKTFILSVREDLETIPGMGDISISGMRRDEIAVEVRQEDLLRHRLSITDVAGRITEAMRELPGGSVRTGTSTIAIRSVGVDERADEIRQIVVKASPGGESVRLGEVATVTSGFVDQPLRVRLNGKPAVSATVFKVGDDDIIQMAEEVKAYVKGRNNEPYAMSVREQLAFKRLQSVAAAEGRSEAAGDIDIRSLSPEALAWQVGHNAWRRGPPPGTFETTTDLARIVVGRLDLLTRNAMYGGALVFLILLVLLNWRVSFWVALGLVVSMLGTLVMMKMMGVTLNLLTMFGLIIVIGILVDDAIVVAENITARHQQGEPALVAAVRGTEQVGWPVVATVLTTIFAFLPLALLEGRIGDFMVWLPIVVGCALLVSLIESLFILPSHMAHSLRAIDRAHEKHKGIVGRLEARMDVFRSWLFDRVVIPRYVKIVHLALRFRYVATAIAMSVVIGSLGLVAGGQLEFIFLETDDAETVDVSIEMPIGTSMQRTDQVVRRIEAIVNEMPEVVSAYALAGARTDINGEGGSAYQTHLGQVILELEPIENRTRTSDALIQDIRDRLGVVPGLKSLRMLGVSGGPGGVALSYTVTGHSSDQLDEAVARIEDKMRSIEGIVDIANDADKGQRELRFELRDGARELGFTRASLGRQIQGTVFGLEAFTFAGDREDVDVRVMLPAGVRQSLARVETMYVFTPSGTPVPLSEATIITESQGYATVRRLDGLRAVTVSADVNRSVLNPEEAGRAIKPFFKALAAEMPGVAVVERGRQQDTAEGFSTLPLGMAIAGGLIYVTLAWLFGSFTQPLIVMSAIPFATVGMIWGHLILGFSLTFLSLIGFVALSGIVVNDSLIYMQFFNEQRRAGRSAHEAAYAAGKARVRAILLTTITTVAGLTPLILERSFQAQFLIPMAITIAAGLISATVVILLVLPCLLVILDDVVHLLRVLWHGDPTIDRANPFVPDPELTLLDRDGV